MPSYLFKLTDPRDGQTYYGEWSTIVDAPVSHLFPTVDGLRAGLSPAADSPERWKRVEEYGISALPHLGVSVERLTQWNRAGKDGTTLDAVGLIDEYRAPDEVNK